MTQVQSLAQKPLLAAGTAKKIKTAPALHPIGQPCPSCSVLASSTRQGVASSLISPTLPRRAIMSMVQGAARRPGTVGAGHTRLTLSLVSACLTVLTSYTGTMTEPTPQGNLQNWRRTLLAQAMLEGPRARREPSGPGEPATTLTMGGREQGCRTRTTPPAAGSLHTGQPPPMHSWPGPNSCRSPDAALGEKREARPPPGRGQTGLQASPAPGLTCPTAHRAGPPHRSPRPGLLLLRLEVGEGDVWAGEAAVLLAVAPVNLHETHGEGHCHSHLPGRPSAVLPSMPWLLSLSKQSPAPVPHSGDSTATRTLSQAPGAHSGVGSGGLVVTDGDKVYGCFGDRGAQRRAPRVGGQVRRASWGRRGGQ